MIEMVLHGGFKYLEGLVIQFALEGMRSKRTEDNG